MTGHTLVPDIDNDQNIFDTHALQEGEKLLAATFLVAVIISFRHVCRLLGIVVIVGFIRIRLSIRTRSHSISHDATLSLRYATLAGNIVQNKVDMSLIADCG